MDSVEELVLQLKNELDNLPEIKEFMQLKKLVEDDEELKKMRLEIARLQNEGKKEEHDNLLKRYYAHPLVNNYLIVREEVSQLLRQIKNTLSD